MLQHHLLQMVLVHGHYNTQQSRGQGREEAWLKNARVWTAAPCTAFAESSAAGGRACRAGPCTRPPVYVPPVCCVMRLQMYISAARPTTARRGEGRAGIGQSASRREAWHVGSRADALPSPTTSARLPGMQRTRRAHAVLLCRLDAGADVSWVARVERGKQKQHLPAQAGQADRGAGMFGWTTQGAQRQDLQAAPVEP